jgi:3-oxoacyl-[acyl-carrier protein] reductase
MSRIIVTGAASGLGREICNVLKEQGHTVFSYDTEYGQDVLKPEKAFIDYVSPDILINCAGVNKIAWFDKVDDELWDEVMEVNVKGILKMSQVCLPYLKRNKGTILNIVSNAAHVPMRCSAAYNASKGAAYILTKQMARELSNDGLTVFSVSPNKLKGTAMSDSIDRQVCETRGWTMGQAKDYQLSSLLTGEETPPRMVAEFIAFLLQDKEHHKYLTGCDLPYGA